MEEDVIYDFIRNTEEWSLETYLKTVERIELLTDSEEHELAIRSQNGDDRAYGKLILTHQRFVVAVAKKYQDRGLSLAELIEEGNLGLRMAIDKFDERYGYRFLAYAVWWIKEFIELALRQKKAAACAKS